METQHIEDALMSPQCYTGQHEVCKRSVSWIAEDGNARTQRCPCRCHDRAPETKKDPDRLYLLSWEYELSQPAEIPCPSCTSGKPGCPRCDGKGLVDGTATAWIHRQVMALSPEVAGDWLDAVAELVKTNRVRNLLVRKAPVGVWETVKI